MTRRTPANAVQHHVSRQAVRRADGRWPRVRAGRGASYADIVGGDQPVGGHSCCMGGGCCWWGDGCRSGGGAAHGGGAGAVDLGGVAGVVTSRRSPAVVAGLPENHSPAGPSHSVTTAAPIPAAQKVPAIEATNQSLTIPVTKRAPASSESARRALRLRRVTCQPRISIAVAQPAAIMAVTRTIWVSWARSTPASPSRESARYAARVARVSIEWSPAIRSHIWSTTKCDPTITMTLATVTCGGRPGWVEGSLTSSIAPWGA